MQQHDTFLYTELSMNVMTWLPDCILDVFPSYIYTHAQFPLVHNSVVRQTTYILLLSEYGFTEKSAVPFGAVLLAR